MAKEIELESVLHPRETALVGRENGETTLAKLKKAGYDFEKLEAQHDTITIIIPERIVSINKSYFLGLFETAVERLGKSEFEGKYAFVTTEHIKEKIKRHIEAATLNATQGEILDV